MGGSGAAGNRKVPVRRWPGVMEAGLLRTVRRLKNTLLRQEHVRTIGLKLDKSGGNCPGDLLGGKMSLKQRGHDCIKARGGWR